MSVELNNIKNTNPYIVAVVILLPAFLAMVASSATNVCQPNIAGYFGATQYEANTVITSYMISNGVMLPIFGWLSNLIGKKRVAYLSLIFFAAGSLLCILVHDLHMLILARVIQGLGGGCLLPLSQAVLLENFPPEKHGVAMGFFGFAAMFSPLAGPFIGGFLTDNYSWQWVFIINIPVSIISIFLIKYFVPESTIRDASKSKTVDIVGISAIAIAMGAMQIVLDRGEQYNWFDTSWICWLTVISVMAFIFFYIWELECKNPIVYIRVFKDKNFLIGTSISSFINIMLYATLLLLPMFVQSLLGYSPYLAGLSVLPRAISCFIALILVGEIADKVENRLLSIIGFGIMILALLMFTNQNTTSSIESVILPNIILGIGIAVSFIPISSLSFLTLPKDKVADAAGLHALFKNIVTATSTSLSATFIARDSQVHQDYLVGNLTPFNPIFYHRLAVLKTKFMMYFSPFTAAKKANGFLYKEMIRQAKLASFYDIFQILALLCIITIPFILLLKTPKQLKKN